MNKFIEYMKKLKGRKDAELWGWLCIFIGGISVLLPFAPGLLLIALGIYLLDKKEEKKKVPEW